LTHGRKQKIVENSAKNMKHPRLENSIRIRAVGPTDLYEDVWDVSVKDDTHCFQLAHCLTGNCGEILLRPRGFCNLSEVVIRSHDTKKTLKEKIRKAVIIGTLQSTLTDFRYLRKEWQKNAEEERLLGVSLTGIMDNKLTSTNGSELEKLLDDLREYAIEVNKEWTEKLGINPATAITCVKPSGTVSQLVDSSSGIHSRYAKYIERAVREDRKNPVGIFLKQAGVKNEPDVTKPNDVDVFYFPLKSPEASVCRNDLTAIQQLEIYLTYKIHWTEHNPSCTIYVRESEWLEVASWVYKHFDSIGGVSFLPHTDHIYKQAPYTEITEEEYNSLVQKIPNIDWSLLQNIELEDRTTAMKELACSSGVCEYDAPETT
jgi:ribonucleoside-diphosphate reductase alpha chain